MEFLSPKLLAALEFAALAHKDQFRKFPVEAPFISHPAAVGFILARAAYEDEVIMAGFLHDVVEDTGRTALDIKNEFGPQVADLVLGVTEDKALPKWDRKEKYLEHLGTMDEQTRAISGADLLANRVEDLKALMEGVNVWLYFSKSETYKDKIFDHDRRRIALIKELVKSPFVEELQRVEKQVVELTKKCKW